MLTQAFNEEDCGSTFLPSDERFLMFMSISKGLLQKPHESSENVAKTRDQSVLSDLGDSDFYSDNDEELCSLQIPNAFKMH